MAKVELKIYEATTYMVQASSMEQALSSFLDNPEMWIVSIDKRKILVADQDQTGYRPLTEAEEFLAEGLGA